MDVRLRQLADILLACDSAAAVTPRLVGPKLLPHFYALDIHDREKIRLRVRLVGTALTRLFGRALEGQFLEDFIHGPRAHDVVHGFHDVAQSGTPLWMRQIVSLPRRAPRFMEGIAVKLEPGRIYGGLISGELVARQQDGSSFERHTIRPPKRPPV